jgi:hypothetical protein
MGFTATQKLTAIAAVAGTGGADTHDLPCFTSYMTVLQQPQQQQPALTDEAHLVTK